MSAQDATQQFYTTLWPLRATLLRTARFLCRNAAEADDLAQETLLKAFKAIASFDPASNAQGWLMTILRNTYIDRLRSSSRWAAHLHLDDLAAEIPAPGQITSDIPDVENAQALLEQFSDARMIAELQRLPEEIRWTLLLIDVQQMAYDEASVILSIPAGTVKSRVHRGRQMLRDRLLAPVAKPAQAPQVERRIV